jgi:hypothetical protein
MSQIPFLPGTRLDDVVVETFVEPCSEVRLVRAVTRLPDDMEIRLDSQLRTEFPVGTQFRTSGKIGTVSRRGHGGGERRPRFVVERASAIVDSIPDDNLRAILDKIKADSSTRRVRNCPSAFKCEKTWDELSPAESAGVRATGIRYCGDCRKNVYLCETIAEICAATKEGKCVAVMAATVADPAADAEDFLGYVENGGDDPLF